MKSRLSVLSLCAYLFVLLFCVMPAHAATLGGSWSYEAEILGRQRQVSGTSLDFMAEESGTVTFNVTVSDGVGHW